MSDSDSDDEGGVVSEFAKYSSHGRVELRVDFTKVNEPAEGALSGWALRRQQSVAAEQMRVAAELASGPAWVDKVDDTTGLPYYVHVSTRRATWTKPLELMDDSEQQVRQVTVNPIQLDSAEVSPPIPLVTPKSRYVNETPKAPPDSKDLHQKARTDERYVMRLHIPAVFVAWTSRWPDYCPPTYTDENVLAHSRNVKPNGWADAVEFYQDPAFDARVTFERKLVQPDGLPLNPQGRTGLRGRGLLPQWGANQATDPVLLRYSNDGSGKLEVMLMLRADTKQWALPGNLVTADGESWPVLRQGLTRLLSKSQNAQLSVLFEDGPHRKVAYQGYVDDSRNTDNAWIETTVTSLVCSRAQAQQLQVLADAKLRLRWHKLEAAANLQLFASHGFLIHQALLAVEDVKDDGVYGGSGTPDADLKATRQFKRDLCTLKIVSLVILLLHVASAFFLAWMAFTPDPKGEGGLSSTVLLCMAVAVLSCVVALYRWIWTLAGGGAGSSPSYNWHNRGFIFSVGLFFVLTLSVWPGTVVYFFHAQHVAMFEYYVADPTVPSALRFALILHTVSFIIVLFGDVASLIMYTKVVAKFAKLEEGVESMQRARRTFKQSTIGQMSMRELGPSVSVVPVVDSDSDDEEEEGVKIKLPHKVLVLVVWLIDVLFLVDLCVVASAQLNSGLVMCAVVGGLAVIWRLRRVKKDALGKFFGETDVLRYRLYLVIHVVVVFVVFFVSLTQFLMLRGLRAEFLVTLFGLSGFRPLQVSLGFSVFVLYTAMYAIVLYLHHRGMSLADEIANIELLATIGHEDEQADKPATFESELTAWAAKLVTHKPKDNTNPT